MRFIWGASIGSLNMDFKTYNDLKIVLNIENFGKKNVIVYSEKKVNQFLISLKELLPKMINLLYSFSNLLWERMLKKLKL